MTSISSQKTEKEKEILRGVLSGRYREQYLVYNRKSTDDTENQKNSIKYQKCENQRFAFREGLKIAPVTVEGFATNGVVSERHSGFKEDIELIFGKGNTVQYRIERPKFHRLVQLLSKGCFKGVVFLCWDRASRNKGDDAIIRKLMKAGVDIRFALAQYDKTSSGALHMDIDGMFAEHHSRVTSEKIKLALGKSRDEGICTYKAPVGYLNEGTMEHKRIDPVRGPIIKRMFELAGTGEWSLADLARWANGQGFTMGPTRRKRTKEEVLAEEENDVRVEIEAVCRPATFQKIQKILENRFYTGRILGNDGRWIKSKSHKALISEGLFEKVRARIGGRQKSMRYVELLDQPFRGMVRCGICDRVYTPYGQKGIMYYGARCVRGGCANTKRNFNQDFITEKIGKLIEGLLFTEDELEEINARASTDIALLEARRMEEIEDVERQKKKTREDLAYLNANRLTLLKSGVYTAEKLLEEEARLNGKLSGLRDEEQVSDASMRETMREVVKLSELLKNVGLYYYLANLREQEQIVRIIFSELTLEGETLKYKCKNGFKALSERFLHSCGDIGWLSELCKYAEAVGVSIEELEKFLAGRKQGKRRNVGGHKKKPAPKRRLKVERGLRPAR